MSRDQILISSAAFLRALGVGLLGVVFALALAAGGLHTGQIGLLVAAGIGGNALGTFLVGFLGDHLGRKKTLLLLSSLTAAGGLLLFLMPGFRLLAVGSLFGMVNAMGRERGALFTLEQAILPQTTDDRHRTKVLAWYNVLLDAGQALGSLLGGLPFFLRKTLFLGEIPSYQWTLGVYALLAAGSLFLYMGLTPKVEVQGPATWHKVSPKSRRVITRLSLLFGLDSIGGGFLPASLIAFWFFKRFGLEEQLLGILFFIAHVANAFSYLGAAWLAKRIGLVKTMVFTHLPANFCLIAIPFAPTAPMAVFLYLIRECLVEMDVPTRQSYVMAVVEPHERTIASSVTNLTRLVAWTVAPTLAGFAMKSLSLGLPLLIGGGIKIVYDLSLYRAFRHLKPPEEQ